ncbi:integrase [Sphingomonas insulae]|uniref:Tyr recombinase domain-containing protein n=1 Tax=Sphingomonas insulae TaxID=424800 RepID=A0ABN1HMM5_9SPHN|nr:site-specific integrase [Sphingomonas insulae]NIJ31645.1 integrase [Sphingomonas insulae]
MPTVLLTVWGGREVWRSLDTDSYAMALRRIHRVAADVEAEFEQARCSIGRAVDPKLLATTDGDPAISMPSTSIVSPPAPPPSTRTIGDVYDRFIADPKHQWSKRTQIAHATTRKWVIEVFDEDTPLTDITREGCRDFVALLREMPRSAHQRYPDMTVREVIAAAKIKGERRLISTANLNAYINRFGGVMNWAMNEGYLDRNPLKGLKLPDPVRKRDKRNPFSPEQLRRIFNAPIYTGCRDDMNGYAVPGDQRPRRARFWVPLIALFSGLRLNEICQLEVSDIPEIDGIPCFRVASGVSLTGDEKRVKTNASERIVPVHDELVRCGFLAFAVSQRLCGETNLFPELPFGHLGYRSTTISRWFTRFLENAGAAAPLTCFHSFRHNFRDGLREAKIDRDVAFLLGGWTTDGKGTVVADNYGSGYHPRALAEALNAVRFPVLNLDHLAVLGLRSESRA